MIQRYHRHNVACEVCWKIAFSIKTPEFCREVEAARNLARNSLCRRNPAVSHPSNCLEFKWCSLCLCFFSVCTHRMVEYSLDLQNINLSAIRTVRVLRPLKAINRVPSENTFSFCVCKSVWSVGFHATMYFRCVRTNSPTWKFMYMYCVSGYFLHLHATCSPWGSLNIHLMLNHTARSDPESQLYHIYKSSINAASLISPWP